MRPVKPPPSDEISLSLDILDAVTPEGRGIRIDLTAEDLDGTKKESIVIPAEPSPPRARAAHLCRTRLSRRKSALRWPYD